jgi:1-deoxy-D-xylulose-5-phosphate reductoisomerase
MAAEKAQSMPCALNAANEEAANAFLRGQCGFLQIADVVEKVMGAHTPVEPNLQALIDTDSWARAKVREALGTA